MQQKSLFDPQNILDNISYENIFDKKFDEKYVSEELSEYFIRFNSDDNSFNAKKISRTRSISSN